MKLVDTIINNLEFKQKKNSSLVSSIEKLKYHDLLSLSEIIDSPQFLNSFSSGWNPSHYAVLNNSLEVLIFICNLYSKNNCDLNQKVQRAKNSVKLGGNTLEIALYNQKLEHYLILKSFNITEHKNCSYFIQSNTRHFNTETKEELNLPFEYSLVNLFLSSFNYVGLDLLKKDFDYDEKNQIKLEFLENHNYLCNHYINTTVFSVYNSFFEKLIEKKDTLDINFFDFFALPFIKDYELKKEKIDYPLLRNFDKLFNNDYTAFFEHLSNSKYKDKMIEIFKEMQVLSNNNEPSYKNIRNFLSNFQIEKLIFKMSLDEKLPQKTHSTAKPNKI